MKNVKNLFKNEVSQKILLFFNENPQSIDTAKGISVWVGCEVGMVQRALCRLVEQGVLISHKTASTEAYSYANEKSLVKAIEKHIKKMKNKRR